MPTTEPGRKLVKQYLKDHGITITDLAQLYGLPKQNISSFLTGYLDSPQQARFLLKVMKDFKIKGGTENERK